MTPAKTWRRFGPAVFACRFQSYPSSHRLTNPMLSDVDTWLMGHCTATPALNA